jgi:hypothetical protein
METTLRPLVMPDPLPSQPGNMFCPAHVAGELERVRERIQFVRDCANGLKGLRRGERMPDYLALRRRERELVERLAFALQGNA